MLAHRVAEVSLTLCLVAYLIVSVCYFAAGLRGLSLAFVAYSVANVGLMLAAKGI